MFLHQIVYRQLITIINSVKGNFIHPEDSSLPFYQQIAFKFAMLIIILHFLLNYIFLFDDNINGLNRQLSPK